MMNYKIYWLIMIAAFVTLSVVLYDIANAQPATTCAAGVTIVTPSIPTATPAPYDAGGLCVWGEPPIACLPVNAAWTCLQYLEANPQYMIPDGANYYYDFNQNPGYICSAECRGVQGYFIFIPLVQKPYVKTEPLNSYSPYPAP